MKAPIDIHPKMYMYKRIVEAKLYIDQNYAEKIELDKISSLACFSKYHFLRLFKDAFGKSPHQYLTEVRILTAMKLLKNNKSISETVMAVGFDSIPSFSRLFKKHTGQSPREFSKEVKRLKSEQQKSPFAFIPNCYSENFGWNK